MYKDYKPFDHPNCRCVVPVKDFYKYEVRIPQPGMIQVAACIKTVFKMPSGNRIPAIESFN